jgi:tRNA G10  N-methylase Trm11
MKKKIQKSWIAISGKLEKINFDGKSDFRFPGKLAEMVISDFSKKGDWVLDPFCGFGTTLRVAQKLGRNAIGYEIDKRRAEFASKKLVGKNRVFNAHIETIKPADLPRFNLLFTSPPYVTVRLEDDPWGKTYFEDMKRIFSTLKAVLDPGANVVVEVSNIRTKDGIRPLAWQLGELLSGIFLFQGEVIRINKSAVSAGPGYDHSYLLIYKNS